MVAEEVYSLMLEGKSWEEACNYVAKKYAISVREVIKAFEQEFGKHPNKM